MANGNTIQPIIVQWNANGLENRARIGELERLVNLYTPICLCIQHVGKYDKTPKDYKIANISSNDNGELSTAIYVHNL